MSSRLARIGRQVGSYRAAHWLAAAVIAIGVYAPGAPLPLLAGSAFGQICFLLPPALAIAGLLPPSLFGAVVRYADAFAGATFALGVVSLIVPWFWPVPNELVDQRMAGVLWGSVAAALLIGCAIAAHQARDRHAERS
jgi:hypothetical protein